MARAPRLGGVRAVFTTRDAGNLARHVGDDPQIVEAHRQALGEVLGAPVRFVEQVHSPTVLVLPAAGAADDDGAAVRADAIVTDRSDIAIGIMVADCMPVLLVDETAGVIGVAHAGRRGLLDGVIQRSIAEMAELGADPARMQAAIGPSICGACYEVPTGMRTESSAILPSVWAETSWGTPGLDLRAGGRAVLESAGVPAGAIDDAYPCTLEDESFFSYRRSSRTGRFVGALRLS